MFWLVQISQLQIGTCHLPLQGLNLVLLQLIFNTLWKEFRAESRNEALCALGKAGRTGLQIVNIFQSWLAYLLYLWDSQMAQSWRVCLQCRWHSRRGFNPWVRKVPWRRKRQPTPVFLPGKSHGQRILAGYSPWGPRESDTTEQACALASSRIWRALNASWQCLLLGTRSNETSSNLLQKIRALIACAHQLPESVCAGFPPCLSGAVSQSCLKCCLPDYNPHFASDKTCSLCIF